MPIDIVRLQKNGAYECEVPLSALAGEMDALAAFGEEWRKIRSKMRWGAAAGLLLGFLILILGPPVVGLVLMAAGIAGFVYAFRYRRGVILHGQRCQIVKSLAVMLTDDANPKAPVSINLAFRSERTLLREAKWPKRNNGREKFFSEPWLTLEAKMLDGTTIVESISDLIRERKFSNSRNKTKTKTRVHHVIGMRFYYPQKVYGDLRATGTKLKDPIHLPATAKLKGLSITDRDVKVKVTVTKSEDVGKSCSMLGLGVYRLMNLGRLIAAQNGGSR